MSETTHNVGNVTREYTIDGVRYHWNRGAWWYCEDHEGPITRWTAVDSLLSGILSALAAARAEVQTLTRDRDGWERRTKELGSVVIRAWALLRDWWQYAQLEEREEPFVDALTRALAADAEHDAYALAEIRRWRDVAGEAARLAQEGTNHTATS